MLLSLKEWRARAADQAEARAEIRARIARIFGLGEADALTVNEIACTDPGCPDAETVVLLMRDGQPTRAVKLPRPMRDVTDIDIETAAASLGLLTPG